MALSLRRANAVKDALVDNSVANDWTYAKMALAVRLLPELFVSGVEIQTQEAHADNDFWEWTAKHPSGHTVRATRKGQRPLALEGREANRSS
jgi:hypothetical protein